MNLESILARNQHQENRCYGKTTSRPEEGQSWSTSGKQQGPQVEAKAGQDIIAPPIAGSPDLTTSPGAMAGAIGITVS
jgi:hypothetical protein